MFGVQNQNQVHRLLGVFGRDRAIQHVHEVRRVTQVLARAHWVQPLPDAVHRRHDRRPERVARVLDVPAHQAAIERHALVRERLLEAVVRRAERELRRQHVGDRRRVEQRLGEQRGRARRRDDGRLVVLVDLVLREALEEDVEPARPVGELRRVLEADAPAAPRLERLVEDLEHHARQLAREQIAPAVGPRRPGARALRRGRRGGRGVLDLLVQGALELRFAREQVAERELELARVAPLGLVAVEPPLEHGVLVGEPRDRVLERGDLDRHLGLDPGELRLELREHGRHGRRRQRRRLVGSSSHASPLHDADRAAQARTARQ